MSQESNCAPFSSQFMVAGLLAVVVLVWGLTWPIMKVGLDYILPLFFGSIRMLIGACFMFAVVILTRQFIIPMLADWGIIFSVGLLQMAIPTALMHFSLLYVDAGRASLLAFTQPIWVAPIAILILNEKLNIGTIGGLFVGVIGLLVLFNPTAFDWHDYNTIVGNGLLICSAMSWAAGIVHVRVHNWTNSPLALSPWQMLIAGSFLFCLSGVREDISQTQWDHELVAILAFVGIVATAFGYWGAVTVSRHLPAMVSSLGFMGVPVIGIFSSALFLTERLTYTLAAGSALILAGLVILAIFGKIPGAGS